MLAAFFLHIVQLFNIDIVISDERPNRWLRNTSGNTAANDPSVRMDQRVLTCSAFPGRDVTFHQRDHVVHVLFWD